MLRSDTAQLAALFVESVFYGVYLVTFGHCLRAIFRSPSGWKQLDEIGFGLLFVALSLFCIGTTNIAFAFYRILDVQEHSHGTAASSFGYLGKPWVNIVKVLAILYNNSPRCLLNFNPAGLHHEFASHRRRRGSGMLNRSCCAEPL